MEVTFMIVKKNEEEFGKYQHLDHRNIWNSTVNFWNTMLPTSTKFDIKQKHQNLGVNHFKNYWYFFTRNRCKFSLNHLGNPKKPFLLKYKRSRKWIKTKSPKSYRNRIKWRRISSNLLMIFKIHVKQKIRKRY